MSMFINTLCTFFSDNTYSVIQYCQRNLVELSTSDIISLPVKDTHGRHLLFLTLLENQDEKTVEFVGPSFNYHESQSNNSFTDVVM